jgi:hypothetical protein
LINDNFGFSNSLHITTSERVQRRNCSDVTFGHAKLQWVIDVAGGQKCSSIQIGTLTGSGRSVKTDVTCRAPKMGNLSFQGTVLKTGS